MDKAELRAAAELVEAFNQAKLRGDDPATTLSVFMPGKTEDECVDFIAKACVDFARHILATVHAYDDEPVTVEKLEALGASRDRNGVMFVRRFYRDGLPIICMQVADGWKVVIETAEFAWIDLVRCRNTVGQMRQTLEGLGVELKGGA